MFAHIIPMSDFAMVQTVVRLLEGLVAYTGKAMESREGYVPFCPYLSQASLNAGTC